MDNPIILDAKRDRCPGVLYDHGTGKRVPFARKINFQTGEVEHLVPAANEVDIAVDPYTRGAYVRKYKAKGKLELIPFGKADKLGVAPPKKVEGRIEPLTKEEKVEGLDRYKKVFFEVWQWRGNSDRVVDPQWQQYVKELQDNDFLDSFVIRRHHRTN